MRFYLRRKSHIRSTATRLFRTQVGDNADVSGVIQCLLEKDAISNVPLLSKERQVSTPRSPRSRTGGPPIHFTLL